MAMNAALPAVDVITDTLTGIQFLEKGHKMFAASTFCCIFAPFISKLLINTTKACKEGNKMNLFKETVLHLPFVTPFINMMLSINHAITDTENPKNSQRIEAAMSFASNGAFHESFLESGNQTLIQILAILVTGTVSTLQIISLSISLLSLTLAACKGFYSQRDPEEADPDPGLYMVLVTFFPMLIMVANSIISWAIILAVLREGIYVCAFVVFIAIFLALRIAKSCSSNKATNHKDEMELEEARNLEESNENEDGSTFISELFINIPSSDNQKKIIEELGIFSYTSRTTESQEDEVQDDKRAEDISAEIVAGSVPQVPSRQNDASNDEADTARKIKMSKIATAFSEFTNNLVMPTTAEGEVTTHMFTFRSSLTGNHFSTAQKTSPTQEMTLSMFLIVTWVGLLVYRGGG